MLFIAPHVGATHVHIAGVGDTHHRKYSADSESRLEYGIYISRQRIRAEYTSELRRIGIAGQRHEAIGRGLRRAGCRLCHRYMRQRANDQKCEEHEGNVFEENVFSDMHHTHCATCKTQSDWSVAFSNAI